MGRTSKPSRVKPTATTEDTEADPVIDLNDMAAVQHGLNGAASEAILAAGYRENFRVSNTRIALGLLTCSWALLAQFYPKKYPANIPVLIFCLVAYGVCTVVLNLYSMYRAGDSFFFATPQQVGHGGDLRLSSSLPRYSHMYRLTIHSADLASAKSEPKSMEKDVTGYFDEDGLLARDAIHADATHLLQTFQRQPGKKSN